MIRRLIEANVRQHWEQPSPEQVRFWLLECRTPPILIDLARRFPQQAAPLHTRRPLLAAAAAGDQPALSADLAAEEQRERDADRAYWAPLRAELERLRRERRGP